MVKPQKKPCIEYERKFEVSELETVKLEREVNGVNRRRVVPIFTASIGVEGLFHVVEKFKKAAEKLGFLVSDLWNEFDEVLDSVAEKKWEQQIRGIRRNDRTQARFEQEVTNFVAHYAGDTGESRCNTTTKAITN